MTNSTSTVRASKVANYSPAQEAIIQAASDAAAKEGRALNFDDATRIAAMPEMNGADGERKARSITAKINRMGLPYKAKEPVTKSGEPVTKKTDLVARIAAVVNGNMAGLEKAPKGALAAIAAYVEAAEAVDEQDEEAANG